MLTIRIHLDECGPDNGPLRVVPRSHIHGVLEADASRALRDMHGETTCTVSVGGALLMRPLILHASSASTRPEHRRVLHFEYAAADLPQGLQWAWRESAARTVAVT